MTRQRFEGKSLDEALESAAAGLGVERYRIDYGVVLEKRGFLGGVKRVVIEAEISTADRSPQPSAEPGVLPNDPMMSQPSSPPPARPQQAGREKRHEDHRSRGPRGREDRSRNRSRDRGRESHESHVPDEVPPPIENETPDATRVREWYETLIAAGKFSLTVRTSEKDDEVHVEFFGVDRTKLLASGGEMLDSLQVLANKALVGFDVEKPIECDCGQFKRRRSEELGEKARRTADRVRRDGREQILPAMSPVERRIVHLALQDDVDVATQSRGEGFFKRVAIVPRSSVVAPADDPGGA